MEKPAPHGPKKKGSERFQQNQEVRAKFHRACVVEGDTTHGPLLVSTGERQQFPSPLASRMWRACLSNTRPGLAVTPLASWERTVFRNDQSALSAWSPTHDFYFPDMAVTVPDEFVVDGPHRYYSRVRRCRPEQCQLVAPPSICRTVA